MTLDTQLFHLPLDEIQSNPENNTSTLRNIGDIGGEVMAYGDPKIIYHPDMGTCMQFDGVDDYLSLVNLDDFNFETGMTIAVWVRYDALQYFSRIIDFSESPNDFENSLNLANEDTNAKFRITIPGVSLGIPDCIELKHWQHFAITLDAQKNLIVYIDGVSQLQSDISDSVKFKAEGFKTGYIGKSSCNDELFMGAMAHLRIYLRALTQTEVQTILNEDRGENAVYQGGSSLKVDLYTNRDNEHLPILYIESDNKGEALELRLTNPGSKQIQFSPVANPGEEDFQVQMCFRRNVIAPNFFNDLKTATDKVIDGWQYVIGTSDDGRQDYISFAQKDNAPFSLDPGAFTLIRIPNFSADAQAGARNTRVEVRFKNDVQNPGSVIRQMEIQNHIGLKTVPLIARVKGSNTLLNNGTEPNELTLEISCTKLGGTVQLSNQTRFTLIVDDELFGSMSKDIHASTEMQGLNAQTKNEGIERTSFAFEVQNENLKIEAGNPLLIQISNFISDAPNGAYNLLLQYEGIPGYWDGAWTIPVEFDPWVIREGNVGIGTDRPAATLHVKGTINLEGDNGSFNTTRPDSDFDFLQNDRSTQRAVTIHGGQQGGNILEVWGKGAQQQNVPGLSVSNKTGHVGVGTVEPKQALHVEGSTYLNGNVGIGTDHPDQKLVVNGRIKDQTGFLMPVGAIIAFGGQVAPEGWLLCDGQTALTDTEHSELKIVLGEGHNDKTPDLRSRFIVGAGQGNGEDDSKEPLKNYQHYNTGGEQKHTLRVEEMPPHYHTINAFKANFKHGGDATETSLTDDADGDYTGLSTNSAGGEGFQASPHNNLPPYYALTYIIKY